MSFITSLIIATVFFGASLGLSLSSVALMSGHSLSQKTALGKLRSLIFGFWLGVVAINILLLSTVVLFTSQSALVLVNGDWGHIPNYTWQILTSLLYAQFLAMILCKIFHPKLTNPWSPAPIRDYLRQRAIKTTSAIEAFNLGVMSVLGNIWLLIVPMAILSLGLLMRLDLAMIIIFALGVSLPIVLIYGLIRHVKISRIQLFLINRASFLHFVAFFSLIVIRIIIFSFQMQ